MEYEPETTAYAVGCVLILLGVIALIMFILRILVRVMK